jgi:hypothetical protein
VSNIDRHLQASKQYAHPIAFRSDRSGAIPANIGPVTGINDAFVLPDRRWRFDELDATLGRDDPTPSTRTSDPPKEDAVEDYIRRENQRIFKRHLETVKDDAQRELLLKLLAAEDAKIPVATR